ncbi:MAG: hypothetical protein U0R52_06020 [Solirubrobacterales bacterium]
MAKVRDNSKFGKSAREAAIVLGSAAVASGLLAAVLAVLCYAALTPWPLPTIEQLIAAAAIIVTSTIAGAYFAHQENSWRPMVIGFGASVSPTLAIVAVEVVRALD